MSDLAAALVDVLQIAHDLDYPHEEPVQRGGGGGAGTLVILLGVGLTLAAVGALVWLKNRAG